MIKCELNIKVNQVTVFWTRSKLYLFKKKKKEKKKKKKHEKEKKKKSGKKLKKQEETGSCRLPVILKKPVIAWFLPLRRTR